MKLSEVEKSSSEPGFYSGSTDKTSDLTQPPSVEFEGRIEIRSNELEQLGSRIKNAANQQHADDGEFALDIISILQDYVK